MASDDRASELADSNIRALEIALSKVRLSNAQFVGREARMGVGNDRFVPSQVAKRYISRLDCCSRILAPNPLTSRLARFHEPRDPRRSAFLDFLASGIGRNPRWNARGYFKDGIPSGSDRRSK